jgi:hypothetical protein
MFALSRSLFVPATTTVVFTMLAGASSQLAAAAREAGAQTPQHAGTEAIAHTTPRDAGVVLAHLQQQLVRVTGVTTPREADLDTLSRALEAARRRPIKPERMAALSEALAAALGSGTFEEVTLQRLAEDLFAVLNNRALSREQAALVAVDVGAALQDLGVAEPRAALVLTALHGVCPAAVAPAQTPDTNSATDPRAPAKRSLLTLSRDSSE